MGVTIDLRLDQQICFALYATSRSVTAAYRPLLDPLGLTYPQYLVLLVLWDRDGLGMHELGEVLELDSGTLSPLVKRLEAVGLVERRRSVSDERRVRVVLTGSGSALRERAGHIPQRLAAATGLPARDLADLRETLTRLRAAVHEATATVAGTEPKELHP